jgi:hypothetical protein
VAVYGGVFCHGFVCCSVCQVDEGQKLKNSREDEVVLVALVSCGKTSVGHEEEAS